MLSANNLCKQFGPKKCQLDLDPICLTLRRSSQKNFLKKFILKKISRGQKSMKNFPGGKELIKKATVLPAKSDNDVMFCLQCFQGLRIDRSLVY